MRRGTLHVWVDGKEKTYKNMVEHLDFQVTQYKKGTREYEYVVLLDRRDGYFQTRIETNWYKMVYGEKE